MLKSVVPGWAPMKANAAIGFALLGALLLNFRSHYVARCVVSHLAAAILVALSAATLLEHALDWNLGIDELLFREEMEQTTRFFQPGRMSPLAGVNFLCLVAAILCSRLRRPRIS